MTEGRRIDAYVQVADIGHPATLCLALRVLLADPYQASIKDPVVYSMNYLSVSFQKFLVLY